MAHDPTMPPEFHVAVDQAGEDAVVRIVGDLDMATVDRLADVTGEVLDSGRRVVFDLAGVSFVDSSGLRFFLDLHRRAAAGELAFALRRARRSVHKTFEVSGLDRALTWEERD